MKPLLRLLTIFATAATLCAAATAAKPERPNIIVIFADDLGYGDLSCYGHPSIRTPHLDRMATEGMRFTDFYAPAPVCTPSRAGLLTGRLPVRSGMASPRRRVLFPNSTGGLPAEEITLPEALKGQGYATACIGKWHLGHRPQYLPTRHGFDYYWGIPYSNDMERIPNAPGGAGSLSPKYEWFNVPILQNEAEIERPANQHTLTKRYTEEAIRFIRRSKSQPFFLYLAHSMPHVPLFVSEDFANKSRRGLYGDVIEELDWSVGQVLDALRKEGLAKNTLVVFTSDNGPWLTQKLAGGSAGPLHEGKGSTWEGGMRVPGIAWWPGKIPAGVVSNQIASALDLFPTSLRLAGAELPTDRPIDGVDLRPVLFGTESNLDRVFFYYRDTELYAVRKGPFKAHFTTKSAYGRDMPVRHDPPLLFNLNQNPSERHNVAAQHPNVLEELRAEVARHQRDLVPGKPQLDGIEQ